MINSIQFFHKCWIGIFIFALGMGCTAPRAITNSGKVTPTGQFRAGFNYGGNVATEPLSQLDDVARSAIDAVMNRDTVFYDEQIDVFARAITAYALDPVGPAFDLYLRYGIAQRVDAGYKYASGAHVLDAMYQFMGATGTWQNPGPAGLYGSVGLQFSTQNLDLGSRFFLDKISSLFNYDASRKDLIVPLIFSKSFGPEEEIGSISWGVVYNHTFIKYGFDPGNIFERVGAERVKVDGFTAKNNFSSFGAFINAKIGYRFIYVLPAITVYYQDYGTYKLLGDREFSYSGMTFIPSIGLQAQFGGRNREKRR